MLLAPASRGGDILRGGATVDRNRKNADARGRAGAETADIAKTAARDRLARTTEAINAVRRMQQGAPAPALSVPDGLVPGGLHRATGLNARWDGALDPVQSGNTIGIKQTKSQAILHWETFNVGRNTTLQFDQSEGKADAGKWIAFNKVSDPTGVPSQILGSIKADGQVYILNQNGIIFGAGSQINTRTLVASAIPINDNLVERGLLNQATGDAQFLFSTQAQAGSVPPAVPAGFVYGDVNVAAGATLSTPVSAEGSGGRIVLAGANVSNAGKIATPAGQTILAAGLQIGFDAHSSADPSLRGLDVFIGDVGRYGGKAVNSGLIEVYEGSLVMAGRRIEQNGAVDSSTSVTLNGRIDLLANYNAVPNSNYNAANPGAELAFLHQTTGTVIQGLGSVTRILPDTSLTATTVGEELPIRSQVNIQGQTVFFDQDAMLLAPNADITIQAGQWSPVTTTVTDNITRGTRILEDFVYTGGQVYLDAGSFIDASGTPDVFVPLSQSILEVQLRSNELSVAPLQRTGDIRGQTLTIDIRRTGSYQGRQWIGTPLGDASGFANIIERNASQLTTAGGSVTIQAGQSVIAQKGSIIDVSGGYFSNEGGKVKTTRLRYGAHLIDIAEATPDRLYDGVYEPESIEISQKWGLSKTFAHTLAPTGAHTQPGYVSGAAGGNLEITAPGMALDGELLGRTVIGPRQLRKDTATSEMPELSSLRLSFTGQKQVLNTGGELAIVTHSPTPPKITFGQAVKLPLATPFREASRFPLSEDRRKGFALPSDFFAVTGFGSLEIENSEGDFEVTRGSDIQLPATGSLVVTGRNIKIEGNVRAPAGTLTFTAYNLPPYQTPIDQLVDPNPPVRDSSEGTVALSETAVLDVSGLLVDDRHSAPVNPDQPPIVTQGGDITLEGYNVSLPEGSRLDASGGVAVDVRGSYAYGDGGSITIKAGQDPNYRSVLGGKLELLGELRGYSGATGGSLAIKAPLIQVGGSPLHPDTLLLQPEFFSRGGFSEFNLTGIGGAVEGPFVPDPNDPDAPTPYLPAVYIAPGTVIEPQVEGLAYVPFGPGGQSAGLRRITRPPGVRPAVSLGFFADSVRNDFADLDELGNVILPGDLLLRRGDIVMSEGARITTEPGGSVVFDGDTVAILGSITAPGGSVQIKGASSFPLSAAEQLVFQFYRPTVYLGNLARISVAGTTVLLPDSYGRRTGTVYDGGRIEISGNIVAQAGAVLDVSGASGVLDFHPSRLALVQETQVPRNAGLNSQPWSLRTVPLQVDSDGGTLVLAGSQMLFTDATLLGQAGGPTAVGGTLEVSSGRPEDPLQRFGSDINLVVAQTNDSFPRGNDKTGIGRPIRDHLGVLVPQMGYFAADDFLAGGFDSLDLGMSQGAAGTARGGNVQFYGPVKIEARGSLRVASGGIIRADSAVSLKAPYIAVGQIFRAPVNPVENLENPFYPFQKFENGGSGPESVLPEFGPGSLTLTADVIDVGTLVLKNIGQASFSAPGGDIRGNGTLSIAGDLTLNAAQIYPTTYSAFNIFAYDHAGVQGSVTVKRSGQAAAPLSAAGSLNIYASIINQGGVLLAPFGSITLGWDGTDLDPTDPNVFGPVNPAALDGNTPVAKNVTLKSGSLTSVAGIDYSSDQGLLIPFGNSPDGLSVIDPRGVNVTAAGLPQKSIAVAGNNVVTEENSLIDIRGGGDLFATQWIPGIGGQVDLLGSASGDWSATTDYAAGDLVTSGGETWSARVAINVADFASGRSPTPSVSPYWTRVAESYAVVPGYGSRIAPHAPFNTGVNSTSLGEDPGYISTNLSLGDRVYLDGGSGLPAGEYTLLPRRYALLPGAFLVTPQDSGPVGTYSGAEGTTFVTGYQLNGLNRPSTLSPLRDRFEVAPARVVAKRAEYATYGLSSFLTAAGVRLDLTEVQRLPIDSGYLLLHGNSGLNLAGRVLSPAPDGGRGSLIDISSFADITIVSPGQSAKGSAVLNAETLSGFGAESLLIGGIRRSNLLGTSVEVRTSKLVLNNAGAPLSGPEITLVSRRELTLAPGAQLLVSGKKTESSDPLLIDGNGVAIRASADETASIHRSNVTGSNLPLLTIGSGAQIEGPSLTLDSSYGFNLASDARIDARTLTLGAGQISLLLGGPTALTGQISNPQLVLTGNVLQDVQSVSSLSLLAYQTSIDIYGPGTFGGAGLKSLSLVAPEIRGFNQGAGSSTFTAGDVFLSNARGVTPPGPSAAPAGSLIFDTNTVTIGGGNLNVSQYENLILNAAGGVSLEGTGGFFAQRNMTINTPLVVAAQGARQNLVAGGTLELNKTGGSAAVLGGLGASLTLRGTSVEVLSDILLPSGLLEIRATGPGGDVLVGGNINLSGRATSFYDLSRYTDGGELRLISETGDVSLLADSSVSVAAAAGGGNAGKIAVQAVQGQFSALGEFLGQAGADGKGGSFELDTLQLASLDVLRDLLNAGGFTESRDVRVRTGNLTVAGTTVTRNYTLAADGGNIDVTGVIDGSGVTGGNISLIARGNLTLQAGSVLTVAAEEFSNAGKGGTIHLEAGAAIGGSPNLAGSVNLLAGSQIDLSVAAYQQGATVVPNGSFTDPTSSAFRGQFQGTLHLRAPQISGNTDVGVSKLLGSINGASSILVEGYRVYTPAGGVMNIALRNSINTQASAFIVANEAAMRTKLLTGSPNSALDPIVVIAPGAEVVNTTGDLTLGLANPTGNTNVEARSAADWDFSTFRYGTRRAPGVLTLRARGNIAFNNSLSDGFTPTGATSESGNSTMWLANLTPIDIDGLGQLYRPINLQSWSFKVTAGSDLAAVNSGATLNLGTPGITGSIFVGEFYAPVPNSLTGAPSPAVGDNGLTANSIRISTDATDRGTRFEVIRNGTGSITLNAARDVQLRNQFATVYTAGVRIPTPQNLFGVNDFRPPDSPPTAATHPTQGALGAVQQLYGPVFNFGQGPRRIAQYSMAGGQVSLAAGQDVGRYTRVAIGGTPTVVKDSSRQLPGNWLYRRGYVDPDTGLFGVQAIDGTIVNDTSTSTTWWIDYSNFFQGIGALGGGDVSLVAGRNIENIDAVAPTNARMSGRDALGNNIAPNADLLLELGGGDLSIVAGNNIDGGVYYVERGEGLLRAGGEITTNEARSPSFGYLKDPNVRDTSESLSWLPTTLYLGKGSFDVTAQGNVLLGPVVNAFLMPQGLNNRYWYKTYFNTYGEDSSVSVTSVQGDVTHRMAVVNAGGAIVSPLSNWLATQNLLVPGSNSTSAYYQPWIRLAESNVNEFASILSILPPRLYSTSVSGDINLVGDINLFPSPTGTLELTAAGSINALQPVGLQTDGRTPYISSTVNVSDANPGAFFGVTSPYAAFTTAKTTTTLTTSGAGFFSIFTDSFTETGSFIGTSAGISGKRARHAESILHAADLQPVRVYANLGDISGLTLFTPKATQIVAGADITDIAFYLQNATPDSVSIVSAGQDVIPFNETSALRTIATQGTNFIPGGGRVRDDGSFTSALQGDIQINGEGVLEVLAGRNIDLGTSEGFADGTGAGITSIGRSRNPFLPFDGSRVIVLAGITGPDDGAALGLRGSTLDFDGFIDQFSAGGVAGLAGANEDLLDLLEDFDSLTPEQQAIAALDVFFLQLRQAAADFNTTGSYEAGYSAIATLFGATSPAGEIFTRTRDIRTTSGGGITIGAPGGGMTMASTLPTASLTPPGVVTEFGGAVNVFLKGDLDIGATRIFTLRGGDLTIWSSEGDIAAGTAAKTVVSAPPTRVTIDSTSAEVQTDLGGLATGGGIGVLASVDGVDPGNVTLIAPVGTVDAGDAGIRATGDITIAAAAVVNADNISAGGASVGVPTAAVVAAPNIAGLSSASSSTGAANSAATQVADQARPQPTPEETPSLIAVEVLGYGGGEQE